MFQKIIVENVWHANSALFIYVSTFCVEQLNSMTRIDTLSWLGGTEVAHPLWVQEVPSSIPRLRHGFFMLSFCFVVVVCLLCVKICHNFVSQNFAISFAMLIYLLSMLNTLQNVISYINLRQPIINLRPGLAQSGRMFGRAQ